MRQPAVTSCSVSQFCLEYDDCLGRLRGLSASTRKLHRYVVRRFLTIQFPDERINWSQLRFTNVVDFLREEFARLTSRDTQRAWLMVLRSVLRKPGDRQEVHGHYRKHCRYKMKNIRKHPVCPRF